MKVAGIGYALGSQIVSNESLLEKVDRSSGALSPDQRADMRAQIRHYLEISGSRQRRWLADGETPLQLAMTAIESCLKKSGSTPKEVDLIVHVGLGRGFLEAGQAYFLAQALGVRPACFDLLDACNSWSRGLHLAYQYLRQGTYDRILVVNTECNMIPGGIVNPRLFEMTHPRDVDFSFAGLTLADGASATLLTRDDSRHWDFRFRSRPDVADLCAVPLDRYEAFALPSDKLARNGVHRFTCFAREMQRVGTVEAIQALLALPGRLEDAKWIFPHGHSKRLWERLLEGVNLDPARAKWNTYQDIGNLASASVPVSMAMAEEAGELRRGDRFITWVGSGGMSFSAMASTY